MGPKGPLGSTQSDEVSLATHMIRSWRTSRFSSRLGWADAGLKPALIKEAAPTEPVGAAPFDECIVPA